MSGELLKKYDMWHSSLVQIGEVIIPRCVRRSVKVLSLEMHHFADASSTGYAAVLT